jgi:hypothetical protein
MAHLASAKSFGHKGCWDEVDAKIDAKVDANVGQPGSQPWP